MPVEYMSTAKPWIAENIGKIQIQGSREKITLVCACNSHQFVVKIAYITQKNLFSSTVLVLIMWYDFIVLNICFEEMLAFAPIILLCFVNIFVCSRSIFGLAVQHCLQAKGDFSLCPLLLFDQLMTNIYPLPIPAYLGFTFLCIHQKLSCVPSSF